ncbi:MAG TPA: hypothetical protein VKR31_09360 [Rhizomicrobium sp.]|nr:hypothetical protein [Rhizomicrobium sp.]
MRAHRDRTKVPVCFSLPDGDVILYGVVVAFEPATEDEPFSEIEFSLITP